MYEKYFDGWDVRNEFHREFVSIFNGWLGASNLHKLDDVKESDWDKFNDLIQCIFKKYNLQVINCEEKSCIPVKSVNSILQTHADSQEKDSSQFIRLLIPELDCLITEDWDYTFIIWYKNIGAVEALAPLIKSVGLYSFHD